LTFLELHPEQN